MENTRPRTRLIGRDRELAAVRDLLLQAAEVIREASAGSVGPSGVRAEIEDRDDRLGLVLIIPEPAEPSRR